MRGFLILSLTLTGCGACGDDQAVGRLPDAPPPPLPDAAIDAMATPRPVTLTITRDGLPVRDVAVYFQQTRDSVVAPVRTNELGVASAVLLDPGGYVTAIDPFGPRRLPSLADSLRTLRTFAGVQPGDELVLSDTFAGEPFTLPLTLPDLEGVQSYDIKTSCGGTVISGGGPSLETSLELRGDCSSLDLLVMVRSAGENGEQTCVISQNDVVVDRAGSIDLSEASCTETTDRALRFTNIPSNARALTVEHYLATPRGPLVQPFTAGTELGGAEASLVLREPVALNSKTHILDASIQRGALHNLVIWGGVLPAELDLAGLLRDLTEPGYSPTETSVTWSEGEAGASPEIAIAEIQARRLVGEDIRVWNWQIAAPYTAGALRYPILPKDVDDFRPGGDDIVIVPFVMLGKLSSSYDAVRPRVFDLVALRNRGDHQDASDNTVFVTGTGGVALTAQATSSIGRQDSVGPRSSTPARGLREAPRKPRLNSIPR